MRKIGFSELIKRNTRLNFSMRRTAATCYLRWKNTAAGIGHFSAGEQPFRQPVTMKEQMSGRVHLREVASCRGE